MMNFAMQFMKNMGIKQKVLECSPKKATSDDKGEVWRIDNSIDQLNLSNLKLSQAFVSIVPNKQKNLIKRSQTSDNNTSRNLSDHLNSKLLKSKTLFPIQVDKNKRKLTMNHVRNTSKRSIIIEELGESEDKILNENFEKSIDFENAIPKRYTSIESVSVGSRSNSDLRLSQGSLVHKPNYIKKNSDKSVNAIVESRLQVNI